MTYRGILQRLSAEYDSGEARAILRLMLEECFSLSWTDVLCGALDSLSAEQLEHLETMVSRLENGEPVQYIIGKAEFMGRTFHVAPGVLIPRPETECLVTEVSNSLSTLHSLLPIEGALGFAASLFRAEELPIGLRGSSTLLDIGTGSGIIAISLALAHPESRVEAWDISAEALAVARGNAASLGADNILFRQKDALSLTGEEWKGDMIVSNPPYVCERERKDMEKHVLDHEPSLALFVPDDDPLKFYRSITQFASKALNKGGHLLFEINREYGKEVAELMKNHGFIDISVLKDQFDNDRIVKGRIQ